MTINYFVARRRNGTRWKNRIADLVDEVLDAEKYDDLISTGAVCEDEMLRLFEVLFEFTVRTGRDFERLRTSGLKRDKLLWEVSVRMGRAIIDSDWEEAVKDHYGADPKAAEPERQRTTKILGLVGSAVTKLLIAEAA